MATSPMKRMPRSSAVAAESLPLLVEGELDDALDFELAGEIGAELRECFGAAVRDLLRPGGPGGGVVLAAEDVEEDEVIEPASVFSAVVFEGSTAIRHSRVLGEEARGGLPSSGILAARTCSKSTRAGCVPVAVTYWASSSAVSQPHATSTSSEMSSGLPAKAEMEE